MPKGVVAESSGLVRSPKHADLFWTHGDSGCGARLHAVDGTGKVRRAVVVEGAKNIDWEDIAADEQGRLIVADIGDNARRRETLYLHRIPEPDPTDPKARVAGGQTFAFRYPKDVGPLDAEALVVRGGFAYVFSKEPKRARVFRVRLPEAPPAKPAVAEFVAETDRVSLLTAADLSADGKHLALLSYARVAVIDLPAPLELTRGRDGKPAPFAGRLRKRLMVVGQAEGIAWDGDHLAITTEGGAVWEIAKARQP